MATLSYTLRIPEELLNLIDMKAAADESSRAQIVIQALEKYFYSVDPIGRTAMTGLVEDMRNHVGYSGSTQELLDTVQSLGIPLEEQPAKLKPVEKAIIDSLPRQEHDTKNCRLYGCLMCKMAGK